MQMIGPSRCACGCGTILDPTTAFQRSGCCNARMVKRRFHYACSHCGAVEASRFLFDERVFDPEYFMEKMRLHRQERKRLREAMKKLLAESHSGTWLPVEPSSFDLSFSFHEALNSHIRGLEQQPHQQLVRDEVFRMEQYRRIILELVEERYIWFSCIPSVHTNPRLDKARRFMTLIFMENDREVRLEQCNEGILVKSYAAHS